MNLSVSIDSPPGFSRSTERRIASARLAISWERIWPRLWPAVGIIGGFIALALLGAFASLPAFLHALIPIGVFSTAGYFLWMRFQDFRWPDWYEGARRLERENALLHRPITERDDGLGAGRGDALAEALWRAHLRAMLARHDNLKLVLPHASLTAGDPYYLRYAILVLLLAGLAIAGSNARNRLAGAFSLGNTARSASLEAWIDPPAYTGESPIYLQHSEALKILAVPTGSALALRVHGRGTPQLSFTPRGEHAPRITGGNEDYSANGRITRNENVSVQAGGHTLGRWELKAIPDQPPSVTFAQPPSRTQRDAVRFAFAAGDDYGVTAVHALIQPVQRAKGQRTLIVDLPLSSSGKTVNDTLYRDLTSDAYAGLQVTITLEARDAVGNAGRSNSVRFTLPARIFTNPLARALVEQRQNLSLNGSAGSKTAILALDALTVAPEVFYQNQTGVYLAIRAAYWALKNARGSQDIPHVQDLLWQTALALERGGLSSAAEELRRLQQLISQALAQGAPQGVIDSLLQRYEEALNRYLRMMAQNPPPGTAAPPKGAKVLNPHDLQALLKAIQQLSQTGNRAQAQQLLGMLQNLLENLHMTAGPGAKGGSEGDKALSDALKNLGNLMGKQRQLLDQTFREREGNPDSKSGGPKGLSQQQGNLRQQLDKLLQGVGPKAGAKDLGEAGKQMGQAQGKLGERALGDAQDAERKALEAMRKGAGKLAQKMMQEQGGREGEGETEDPLGRENGGKGPSFGDQVKVPDKSTLERARNILNELRRRAEQRGRPKQELDYIERLLKQF